MLSLALNPQLDGQRNIFDYIEKLVICLPSHFEYLIHFSHFYLGLHDILHAIVMRESCSESQMNRMR